MKKSQKSSAVNVIILIIALLAIGGGVYFYTNSQSIIAVPDDLSETANGTTDKKSFDKTRSAGQIINFSNKDDKFHEKITDVIYFNENRYVFFKTLTWDLVRYYLIDQSNNTDLLVGENKYLTANMSSQDQVKYVEQTNSLVIKTFTNDLVGDGFNGILIVNFDNGSITNQIKVERKDYSSEEDLRIRTEVDSLFEKFTK